MVCFRTDWNKEVVKKVIERLKEGDQAKRDVQEKGWALQYASDSKGGIYEY
jgi:hypothetical protein